MSEKECWVNPLKKPGERKQPDPSNFHIVSASDMAREGKQTSEFQQARRAQISGEVAMWLGIAAAVLLGVGEWLGAFEDSKAFWGALLVVVAGTIQQVLAANGYGKNRAAVKAAALKGKD